MRRKSYIISFVVIVCSTCAVLLSLITSMLEPAQDSAKKLDQYKQMMVAAKIISYEDTFLLFENNLYTPARFDPKTQTLIPSDFPVKATRNEILQIYQRLITPKLVDENGQLVSFQEAQMDYEQYLAEYKKSGYSQLPFKLIYQINKNDSQGIKGIRGYIIPINGYGLWDAIYGYLAIEGNGDTVIGTTWYQQAETAGLGAEIATQNWQKQFTGKVIFQKSSDGSTNFSRAPLGITVVKGEVKEVLGSSPKAESAVDGISGASMTGEGVTIAYQSCLNAYRPFLIRLHDTGTHE